MKITYIFLCFFTTLYTTICVAELKCSKDTFLAEYTSKITGERKVWCAKKIDGKYIKHGAEIIYKKNGEIKSKNHYELDKLTGKDKVKLKKQSTVLRKTIESRILDTRSTVYSIAFDPNGKHFAIATDKLELWDIEQMQMIRRFDVKVPWSGALCLGLHYHSSGNLRCEGPGGDHLVEISNINSAESNSKLITEIISIRTLLPASGIKRYSADLSRVYTSYYAAKDIRGGQVWDFHKKQLVWRIESFKQDPFWLELIGGIKAADNHDIETSTVCFTPNAEKTILFFSDTLDNTISPSTVWTNWMKVIDHSGNELTSKKVDIDLATGARLIGCGRKWLIFWEDNSATKFSFIDIQTGHRLNPEGIPPPHSSTGVAIDHRKRGAEAVISNDGKYFAYPSGNNIVLLDLQKLAVAKVFGESTPICHLSFSFNNKYLFSTSGKHHCMTTHRGPMRLWHLMD